MALIDGPNIYLGADGALTESYENSQVISAMDKLHRHQSALLAWGMAGGSHHPYAEEFNDWLAAYHDPLADWRATTQAIAEHVADMNRQQRELIVRSGEEPPTTPLTSVLVVVGAPLLALEVFDDSGHRVRPGGPFATIGTGAVHARVCYLTLRTIGYETDALNRAILILKTATSIAPNCLPPYHMLVLTPSGIDDLPHEAIA